MPTPDFIVRLRASIGHEQLLLPGVSAIIVQPVPDGAPLWQVPTALLVRRADTGQWAPVEGICEPGEEITTSAVREVAEETGLEGKVEGLLGVGQVGPVTYSNGDQCTFINTAVRVSVPADATPRVNDDENLEVGWFSVAQLPTSVSPRSRLMIADAIAHMKHPTRFVPRLGFHKRTGT